MTVDLALDLGREAMMVALLLSAPMLVAGMVVGIVLSLLQAVTQIQEQTLTFVPKIVAMVAAAVLTMPWMAQKILEYSAKLFGPF
ncbi:MAG: flagellar biosynthesis protein FliQ [Phycisphaerae bacterium]|nr:flagellar biosynthesis protein FliQ [Phycisphaerae bacterium]